MSRLYPEENDVKKEFVHNTREIIDLYLEDEKNNKTLDSTNAITMCHDLLHIISKIDDY